MSAQTKNIGKKRSTTVIAKLISKYFETQPVVKAWLFGSFARGEQTAKSDVDILFEADRNYDQFSLFTLGAMYSDLHGILGRDIDLVETEAVKPIIKEHIEKDKILIYERKNTRIPHTTPYIYT